MNDGNIPRMIQVWRDSFTSAVREGMLDGLRTVVRFPEQCEVIALVRDELAGKSACVVLTRELLKLTERQRCRRVMRKLSRMRIELLSLCGRLENVQAIDALFNP
jgi:hypothetical protein